jgi:hypothetical protein
MDSVQSLKVKNIGRTAGSAYLVLTEDTIKDMADQKVVALTNNADAMQTDAATFFADQTPPTVDAFSINLNALEVTMAFSESVRTSVFSAAAITLVSNNFIDYTCPCSTCFDDEWMVNGCTQTVDTICTVRVFMQDFALEDAIGSHACSFKALTCVCPMSFLLGLAPLLPLPP